MQGSDLTSALHDLARDFDQIAVPSQGKYIETPAIVADGSVYKPHDT